MTQNVQASGVGNIVVQIEGDGNSVVTGLPHLELTRYHQRRVIRKVEALGMECPSDPAELEEALEDLTNAHPIAMIEVTKRGDFTDFVVTVTEFVVSLPTSW